MGAHNIMDKNIAGRLEKNAGRLKVLLFDKLVMSCALTVSGIPKISSRQLNNRGSDYEHLSPLF